MVNTTKNHQWVVPHQGGWAVKGAGDDRLTRITRTQQEAIEIAKSIARDLSSEVIVQSREGRIVSVIGADELADTTPQHERIKALLAQWETEEDDTPATWWDEFNALLESNRLNLNRETD